MNDDENASASTFGSPLGHNSGLRLRDLCASGRRPIRQLRGYKPAYQVTDDFMRTFNSKDAEAWGSTFLFPSVRLASNKLTVINSPKDLESSFDRLGAQGWDHSAWAMRKVVQCGPTKAHMLTTFVRYKKDGTVLSQFDSLYIVELRDGRWGLAARSSFAP